MVGEAFVSFRRVGRIACLTALLVIAATSSGAQEGRSNLQGEVSASQAPLSEVKIRVLRKSGPQTIRETFTDADGQFQLFGLPWGTYDLEFSADGWQKRSFSIELRPGSTLDVNAELSPTSSDRSQASQKGCGGDIWFGTNFTNFNLQQLPNGRNIWSLLQTRSPRLSRIVSR